MQADACRNQGRIVPPQVLPNTRDNIAPALLGYFRWTSCSAAVRIVRQGIASSFIVNVPTNVLLGLAIPRRFELPLGSPSRGSRCSAILVVSVVAQGIFYTAAWDFQQLVIESQPFIAAATSLNTATDSSLPV
ncbi:MAG TPA: hypothetical protein VI653_18240 [Steroidobacteraceae bacterium]